MNYKNNVLKLGGSDIACLTLRGMSKATGCLSLELLNIGGDGSYSGYIVEDISLIPEYYKKVSEFKSWLDIIDDDGVVAKIRGDKMEIYRAGDYGILIYIENLREIEEDFEY